MMTMKQLSGMRGSCEPYHFHLTFEVVEVNLFVFPGFLLAQLVFLHVDMTVCTVHCVVRRLVLRIQ